MNNTTKIPQPPPGSPADPLNHWKGSNGGGTGWGRHPETGERIPPKLQDEFLDWILSDPRDPEFMYEWAESQGIHRDTPKRWKRDPKFIAEWEKRAKEKNISVDRVQSVVDSLFRQATVAGDVKAAQLYLQYIDRFTPKMKIVSEQADTEQMTDDELRATLADELGDVPHLRAVGDELAL